MRTVHKILRPLGNTSQACLDSMLGGRISTGLPRLAVCIQLPGSSSEPSEQKNSTNFSTGSCFLVPCSFGLAFRKGTERSFVDVFDEIVLQMQEDGVVSEASN